MPRTRTLPGIASPRFPYAQPEEVGLSSQRLDRLGEEVVSWVAAGDLVGAELLIVKDGRAVYHEAYGWSDREAKQPVRRNSIWSIKSMAKPFTSAAVLMLAEEGKLSLDDHVSRYIPGFAGDQRTTIRHLLSHTSGYHDEVGDPFHDSYREWIEHWASKTPLGNLGEYRYSDFGYGAAGYIVEAVSGLPIDQFTEQRIIAPLRLHDTQTSFSDDRGWRARLNPFYRWNHDAAGYHLRWTSERPAWPFYPAAWGMFSTAMDYAAFMAMWLDRGERQGVRLLSPASVEEALRQRARGGFGGYGYGWFVEDEPVTDGMPAAFGHGGGDGTLAVAFPAVDAIVILMTHSRGFPHGFALTEAMSMLEIFDHPGYGLVWADQPALDTAALRSEEVARYAGTYADRQVTPRLVVDVRERNGILHLRSARPGGRAASMWAHLIPLDNDRFAYGRYDGARPGAVHPTWIVEFMVEHDRASAIRVTGDGDTLLSARRADADRILADVQARRNRISAADTIAVALETEGIAAARERLSYLSAAAPDSVRFNVVELTTLGVRLLHRGAAAEAIALLEMTSEAFPAAAEAFDAIGDAYRLTDRLEDARRSYARAVELAERQGHEELPAWRAKLEWVTWQLERQR